MKTWNLVLVIGLATLAASCGYSHNYMQPTPGTVPAIAQLMPNSTTHGDPTFTLTVNGSNFNPNAVINFGNATLTTTYVSTAQVTASVPASDVAAAGAVAVTVTNPGKPGGQYGGGTQSETSNPPVMFTVN